MQFLQAQTPITCILCTFTRPQPATHTHKFLFLRHWENHSIRLSCSPISRSYLSFCRSTFLCEIFCGSINLTHWNFNFPHYFLNFPTVLMRRKSEGAYFLRLFFPSQRGQVHPYPVMYTSCLSPQEGALRCQQITLLQSVPHYNLYHFCILVVHSELL